MLGQKRDITGDPGEIQGEHGARVTGTSRSWCFSVDRRAGYGSGRETYRNSLYYFLQNEGTFVFRTVLSS